MVILGLGSNIGDRLAHLRLALNLIKNTVNLSVKQISPIYLSDALLPENASASWNLPFLNIAIRCETLLTPHELLECIKKIEKQIGRTQEKYWGPRIIDIDILAWDSFVQEDKYLHIPHKNLHERPFALWPLADVAPRWIYPLKGAEFGKTAEELAIKWGSRFTGGAPLHTRQIQQRIDTPQLVGILNITPDSFSGDGYDNHVEHAVKQAHQLVAEGAEIIDIGAEATGPLATPIHSAEEIRRLEPVLKALMPTLSSLPIRPKISIDTRYATTAKKALAYDINWINDVSGLHDINLQKLIAEVGVEVVIMHNLGIPVSLSGLLSKAANPVSLIYEWGEKKLNTLQKAGIEKERIIFDIGIGYGHSAEQALELIKKISVFKNLKTRLLVGHSRKSFLKQFTEKNPNERDIETLVASLYLSHQSVDYLRIHQVEITARAFKVAQALLDVKTFATV